MDCHRAVGVDFLQEFDVHIFYPVLEARSVLLEFAPSQRLSRSRQMWDIIFSALLLQLLYDVDVVCH